MAITEIEDRIQNIIEQDNHEQFIYDFLSVYDFPKATITKLRKGTNNLAKEPGEVYLKNRLYFKQVESDLMQSFVDVKDKVSQLGSKPRYIMVTDFKNVLAEDTKTNDTLDVEFERLPQKFEFFLAWNGIEKADFDKENPADIRAAERFAKLYDVVVKDNPKATRHGLNLFLIRILFCLFAEDTDIFEKNLFTNRLKELTNTDGSDLDDFITRLFSVLDVEKSERPANTPSWLSDFPYVDGDLFKDPHEHLKFTEHSRKLIIDAGEKLEWDQINPDILGSMIQAVASEDSRSHLGMHYTSVPNIMKVIKPLFLDNLRQAFDDAKGNEKKLNQLYDRIGHIKFMDPACGSGNFLIITYKELRQLEIDILKELNQMGIATMYVPSVTLNQFYGIEIDDFACDVTRLSLWIAEHQMNIRLRKEIDNAVRPTLPLQHAGAIVCGNALLLNWINVMSSHGEAYIFGNPPYLGANNQTKEQKEDLKSVFNNVIKTGELDYICGWSYKAAEYISKINSNVVFSFVTTNSLTEGKLVGIFWPLILNMNLEITSAYHNFKWTNNAKGKAQVIVEIIQIAYKNLHNSKKIYYKNSYEKVDNINVYLNAGPTVIVQESKGKPIFNLPEMYSGNRPTDGRGQLRFTQAEYAQFISEYPQYKNYFRRLVGGKQITNSTFDYVLWINKKQYQKIQDIPVINTRIEKIKVARKNLSKLRETPWQFRDTRAPLNSMIVIPATSSSSRSYIPMTILDNRYIANNSTFVIYDAPMWLFGLLESKIHMVWADEIAGKLKTDFRYSKNLAYNTFPVPDLSTRRKNEIEDLVWNILDIRDEEEGTLAELYGSPLATKNPKPMNPRLKAAHEELDQVVDRAYRDRPFKDDNERLALLLSMYSNEIEEDE
ncbi:class I SAM-dependent DNA methyltransferase [Limosilactobacillus fastidiosus]|uniref:site-specific DNA-methyltransferase (adenine-specific) n=1 Tax=Limosilactobacillus fastidiosus TaxID=2759855 RepID=A0A7W3TZ24_9LACO|nr:class I SAM-dependent DNA methyltransferase [Limosilactobacillus fastidiosus]MBB1085882.1 class I SAM-dependent DNA methyltransferase [Limosilactobacillus fastidiosus]MCD7085781.1 class I SAM-dependent DNA methyltransferase [Limosilactobacillus fastidiosus]MCD7113858.1 class I SAM-dependent DNA methyltransferase [Limosilactobacillus fastidiosus]MCD7115690.1 class I SAM-dependent DNA methyltransferase [Limosilactobacillus fastidiosus]